MNIRGLLDDMDRRVVERKIKQNEWHRNNRIRLNEYQRNYNNSHPEFLNRKREYMRNYMKEFIKNPDNAKRIKLRTKIWQDKISEWLNNLKQEKGCSNCGVKDYRVLTFHHLNPAEKEFGIGRQKSHSRKAIELEISKCEILCANCHRIEEWNKRNGSNNEN